MRICKDCGATEDSVRWVTKHGRREGLCCSLCASRRSYKYARKDPEATKARLRTWYLANKEIRKAKMKAYNAAWYLANKETASAKSKAWSKANPGHAARYMKQRAKDDHLFKLMGNLRSRLYCALKAKRWVKTTKFQEYIGCSLEELRAHLEAQFREGMSWEARHLWHIDHIIPLASAASEGEMIRLCHFKNLQPLWAVENIIKSDKIM